MPLSVVESNRFYARETFKCPGETDGRILPTGEKDESCIGCKSHGKSTVSIPLRRPSPIDDTAAAARKPGNFPHLAIA